MKTGPCARSSRLWWLGILSWVAACAAASAEAPAARGIAEPPLIDLDQRYPKGAISSASIAKRALADVAEVTRAIDAQYEAERTRCAHVFLATQCQDNARRAHTLGQTKAHRVEVEAHDLQRHLAANQRESRRDIDREQQRSEDAARPEKERLAQDAAQKRTDGAEQRRKDALLQQAQAPAARERFEKRNADYDRDQAKQADVKIRSSAENTRRYQDKQARAKTYAADRARERDENQKARAERERERQLKTQTAQGSALPPPETKP